MEVAEDSDLEDGTASKPSGPCYGLFTFESNSNVHQETSVALQSNTVMVLQL
jgi:hypothetical protein